MSAVTLHETNQGKVLEIHITGKLTKEDYEHFTPIVEKLVKEHGKIRLLVEMHDSHGCPGICRQLLTLRSGSEARNHQLS